MNKNIAIAAPVFILIVLVYVLILPSKQNEKDISHKINLATTNIDDVTTNDLDENQQSAIAPIPKPAVNELSIDQRYKKISTNESYLTIDDRITEMSARRDGKIYTPEEVIEAMEADAWEATDDAPQTMNLTDIERTDGREFIKFNALKIETLMPGDKVELPIKTLNQKFEVKIDSVDANDGGSLSWSGKILNNDNINSVIITQSDQITLAGIDTPEGHYVLQAHDGAGWIASNKILFKRSDSDVVEPK